MVTSDIDKEKERVSLLIDKARSNKNTTVFLKVEKIFADEIIDFLSKQGYRIFCDFVCYLDDSQGLIIKL